MRKIEGDGRCLAEDEGLFQVDLDKADKRAGTSSKGAEQHVILAKELHDALFELKDGVFVESCGHGVREAERM